MEKENQNPNTVENINNQREMVTNTSRTNIHDEDLSLVHYIKQKHARSKDDVIQTQYKQPLKKILSTLLKTKKVAITEKTRRILKTEIITSTSCKDNIQPTRRISKTKKKLRFVQKYVHKQK